MESRLRFRLLGPVEVWSETGPVDVGTQRQRAVLAALAADAGRVVPVATVVDRVWGEAPPDQVRDNLYVYVARLRKALGRSVPLHRRANGYLLDVAPDDVDVHRFRRLVASAGSAADPAVPLEQALDLWRGTPLSGLAGEWAARLREAWHQQRVDAAVSWAAAMLAGGQARAAVGRLTELAAEYPLAEALVAALMRVLAATGRGAEALDLYARTRRRLVDELGADPGTELQELHRSLLRGTGFSSPPVAVSRRCLPRDVSDFTGRQAAVTELVKAVPDAARVAVISAVDGMAGMGKTALAVHVAHLVADRYPDAQLFVDLHGHSERAPLEPAAALGALLRQLGIPADRIPEPLDERVAMWRTSLGDARALVVLDNAADTDQVVPLLPGSPSSLTLVTSRRRLVGLDGVHPVSLEVLSPDEAVQLLERVVGDRVAADPGGASEVARLCGYLPLAVRLAAARLAHRPTWTVADLARRLREATPLAELAAEGRTVAAAFTLSYQHLGEPAQRVFRLLGLIPGTDFDAYGVAALADLTVAQAGAVLEDLVDAHLVQAKSADRYRLHDLLRDYARSLATATDPEPVRDAALARLLDYYFEATARATEHYEIGSRMGLELVSPPKSTVPSIETSAEADMWLDAEWQNVLAATENSHSLGWDRHVWQLTRAVWAYLWRRGHNTESVKIHEQAVGAAVRLDDKNLEAAARNYLASAYFRLGRGDEVLGQLECALQLHREVGNEVGSAVVHANLAVVYRAAGRLSEALKHGQESRAIALRLGMSKSVAIRTESIIGVYIQLGRYTDALKLARENIQVAHAVKEPYGTALSLGYIGVVHIRQGRPKLATALLKRARQIKRDTGHRYGEAESLSDLGSAYRQLGLIEQALACQHEALAIARDLGDSLLEAMLMNNLGITLRMAGDAPGAVDAHRTALNRSERSQLRYEAARAHGGLGVALRDSDAEAARRHCEAALTLYTAMGAPDPDEVERNLVELAAG
jgi:DNA-binding SARP family transcriptional activator/tetratricopeptide (TPR) repeat protein